MSIQDKSQKMKDEICIFPHPTLCIAMHKMYILSKVTSISAVDDRLADPTRFDALEQETSNFEQATSL
jgi:hypothetical protein